MIYASRDAGFCVPENPATILKLGRNDPVPKRPTYQGRNHPSPKLAETTRNPLTPRLPLMQALYIVDSKLLLLCYDYQSFKVVTEVPKSVLTQLFLNTKKNTYEVLNQLAAHY